MIWTKRWRASRKSRRIVRVAALLRQECAWLGTAVADRTDEFLARSAAEMEKDLRREIASPLQVRRVRTIRATARNGSAGNGTVLEGEE